MADNDTSASTQPPFRVVLASASPRRSQLLEEAGVPFEVILPTEPVDEKLDPDEWLDPEEACKKLAQRKAGAVVQEILAKPISGLYVIIGADTMVVKDGKVFGKPRSLSEGTHMLKTLSGATHEVITAVSVWMVLGKDDDDVSVGFRTFVDKSYVTFHPLTDEEIADYLRKGESFDKAGAYAAQGEGAALIKNIDGALDTVIGLPVQRLLKEFPDIAALKKSV